MMARDLPLLPPIYYIWSLGCNAEYTLVDERLAGHKPKNLTFEEVK
jgi:NADPH:quinone reductase-like Zn-dependent oxidoreductase